MCQAQHLPDLLGQAAHAAQSLGDEPLGAGASGPAAATSHAGEVDAQASERDGAAECGGEAHGEAADVAEPRRAAGFDDVAEWRG